MLQPSVSQGALPNQNYLGTLPDLRGVIYGVWQGTEGINTNTTMEEELLGLASIKLLKSSCKRRSKLAHQMSPTDIRT